MRRCTLNFSTLSRRWKKYVCTKNKCIFPESRVCVARNMLFWFWFGAFEKKVIWNVKYRISFVIFMRMFPACYKESVYYYSCMIFTKSNYQKKKKLFIYKCWRKVSTSKIKTYLFFEHKSSAPLASTEQANSKKCRCIASDFPFIHT